MKSKKYFFITYSYYFILFSLIFLYLFPGSLLGYLFYGDFGKQPQLVPNYLGSFINHYLAFFTTSILGLINDKVVLWKRASFLIFLSIILEFCHTFIPNRSFEFIDLIGNLIGAVSAIMIVLVIKKWKVLYIAYFFL